MNKKRLFFIATILLLLALIFGFFICKKSLSSTKMQETSIATAEKLANKPNKVSNLSMVEDYRKQLEKLPAIKFSSINKAKDLYFTSFSMNNSQEDRDNAFKIFKDYYKKIILNNENNIATICPAASGYSPDPECFRKKLDIYGIGVAWEEGEPDFVEKPEFLNKTFSSFLGQSWNEYLKYKIKEYNEGFQNDAALLIPWDGMRERIIFLENFVKKYPDFCEKEIILSKINLYLDVYLFGMDNSPTFKYGEIRELRPEAKDSYEKFLEYNKNSKYYSIILDYYNLIKANNYKYGEYVSNYEDRINLEISYDYGVYD